MPRKTSPSLTDGEARLMRVLWEQGPMRVSDVVHALGRAAAYNTVLTMLRILERKGYVANEKNGRAFVFRAVIDRREARRTAVRHLARRLFDSSPRLLVLNVLRDEQIDVSELRELEKLLDKS